MKEALDGAGPLDGNNGDFDYRCAALKALLQAGIKPGKKDLGYLRHLSQEAIKDYLSRLGVTL